MELAQVSRLAECARKENVGMAGVEFGTEIFEEQQTPQPKAHRAAQARMMRRRRRRVRVRRHRAS
ncbi:MAG: hypothetical protein CL731_02300 [Chloroflexi bacterium]|nr:hypothetical protein [Chloroflexota bacterium]